VLTGVVTGQAIKVSQSAMPWVKAQIEQPGAFTDFSGDPPFYDQIVPHSELILRKAGEMVGSISHFLINNLSSATLGAVQFLFMLFVWLYTMYFFLMDGDKLLEKILYYLPLQDHDEQQMLDRFHLGHTCHPQGDGRYRHPPGRVGRSGILGGGHPQCDLLGRDHGGAVDHSQCGHRRRLAAGSAHPGIGGAVGKAVGLFVFCGLVVGSLDNLLRPILVGKDTQMHELMIFFGTMGGIFMFGMVGVIIGPIIAALFVTVWEIYGQAFEDILPDTGYVLRKNRRRRKRRRQTRVSETHRYYLVMMFCRCLYQTVMLRILPPI
jgi:hypothetical protein